MKKTTKLTIWIVTAGLLCCGIIAGVMYYFKQKDSKRDQTREEILSTMVAEIDRHPNATFIVDENALPVLGDEGFEEFEEEHSTTASIEATSEPSESIEPSETTESVPENTDPPAPGEDYTLTAIGNIAISSIDSKIPLYQGAGKVELRYGAGHNPATAMPGQTGNCVIYGHRMRKYGLLWNRLGEVAVGDSIKIIMGDTTYTYIVDQTITIEPSEISQYINADDGSAKITLITCTPTGVGSHRLLVIGHIS